MRFKRLMGYHTTLAERKSDSKAHPQCTVGPWRHSARLPAGRDDLCSLFKVGISLSLLFCAALNQIRLGPNVFSLWGRGVVSPCFPLSCVQPLVCLHRCVILFAVYLCISDGAMWFAPMF
jgi:hypothetical protein